MNINNFYQRLITLTALIDMYGHIYGTILIARAWAGETLSMTL